MLVLAETLLELGEQFVLLGRQDHCPEVLGDGVLEDLLDFSDVL